MRLSHAVVAAALLALSACRSEPERVEPPSLGEALPSLPLPPGAKLISSGGSVDAAQLVLQTPAPAEGVAEYYRGAMSAPGWRLIGDTKDSTGAYTLYGEGPTRPMWVRVRTLGSGTEVTITGAVPGMDTTFARKQADTRDTTNTLMPR